MGIEDICIDTDKGDDIGQDTACEIIDEDIESVSDLLATPYARPEVKKDFSETLTNAKKLQSDGLDFISQSMEQLQLGKPVNMDEADVITGSIVESLSDNYNALMCLTQLRNKDSYLLQHSFNVSVFMGMLAASLNIQGEDLDRLVTGALLHDVGKINVDDEILHKPGKLTAEEWQEMRMHVTYGETHLQKIPGLAQEIMDICAQHHERLDGTGYPRGLSGDEIPTHSRMASIVDVYDAITADRVYHSGMAPTLALRSMLEWSEKDGLDKDLLYQFIRCLSIYPQGSFVLLSNQLIGIVQSVHPTLVNKPQVSVVYDLAKKIQVPNFLLDLSESNCSVRIERVVNPKKFGLDAYQLMQTLS
jgi:putative nucleotidyltransferase with HDIG domain